jgi:hypothetical protein
MKKMFLIAITMCLGVAGASVACAVHEENQTTVDLVDLHPTTITMPDPDACPEFDDQGNPVGSWEIVDEDSFGDGLSEGTLPEADTTISSLSSAGLQAQYLIRYPGGAGKTLQQIIDYCRSWWKKGGDPTTGKKQCIGLIAPACTKLWAPPVKLKACWSIGPVDFEQAESCKGSVDELNECLRQIKDDPNCDQMKVSLTGYKAKCLACMASYDPL